MRTFTRGILVAALAAAFPGWLAAQGQTSSLDQVVDRIVQREQQEMKTVRQYSPIIETYIQDLRPDKDLGTVPVRDHYFLGKADLTKGIVDRSMLEKKSGFLQKLNIFSHLAGVFSSSYVPEGFLEMIFVDANGIDRQHYHFDYVRREFLGEVRCLVFDLMPLPHTGNGRFKGRIWVEDQDYAIVRFNGVYVPEKRMFGFNLHFDSWRMNVAPGLWVPASIYSAESDLKEFLGGHVRFKSQTRLWGYNLSNAGREQEFSQMTVDAPMPVKDQAQAALDRSPVESQRAWAREAEQNVVDRLERAGLVAPSGEMDKVLETVVNNIEVTNSIDVQPEIRCRVLVTGTLESFAIGHTIVLSRGLLDVLPDEASLATMLAHEMGHILLGHTLDQKYAFSDRLVFANEEALQRLNFHGQASDEQAANKKGVELLKNSPYKDKLANAGLFMKQLDAESKQLPALVNSHLGSRVFRADDLVTSAPNLEPARLDQIAALPLGARVKLDPWDDRVELVKSKPVALLSQREKMPFEVTPFMPYLTRKTASGAAAKADDPAKADLAKKQ